MRLKFFLEMFFFLNLKTNVSCTTNKQKKMTEVIQVYNYGENVTNSEHHEQDVTILTLKPRRSRTTICHGYVSNIDAPNATKLSILGCGFHDIEAPNVKVLVIVDQPDMIKINISKFPQLERMHVSNTKYLQIVCDNNNTAWQKASTLNNNKQQTAIVLKPIGTNVEIYVSESCVGFEGLIANRIS